MNKRLKEDMVAGPYNPDRTPSLGDTLEKELGSLLQKGRLAPVIHSRAIDFMRRTERQLNDIYGGSRAGVSRALHFVLTQAGKGLK